MYVFLVIAIVGYKKNLRVVKVEIKVDSNTILLIISPGSCCSFNTLKPLWTL